MSLLKIMILPPKMYLLSGVTLVEISIYVIVIKVNSRARPHNSTPIIQPNNSSIRPHNSSIIIHKPQIL